MNTLWQHLLPSTKLYMQTSLHPPTSQTAYCTTCTFVAHMHERSVIKTRQKATMPEDDSFFLKRKRRAASGRTCTCIHVCSCVWEGAWIQTYEAVAAYPMSLIISASSIENCTKRGYLERDGETHVYCTCMYHIHVYMYIYTHCVYSSVRKWEEGTTVYMYVYMNTMYM